MKYQFLILSLSILFLNVLRLSAQSNADCSTAFDVCKKQTFKFDKVGGEGRNDMEAEFVPCFMNSDKLGDAELNSTWIKLTIEQGGSLEFTITPYRFDHDYDFVVYRLASAGDCNSKQIVRCMASGDPNPNSPCMSQTGLRRGEKDSSEDAGCADESDNAWLAPLKVATGEHYLILVSNVTEAGPGFSISFGGTAMLPCEVEKPVAEKPAKPAKSNTTTAPPKPASVPEPIAEAVLVKPSVAASEPAYTPTKLGDRNVEVKKEDVLISSRKIRVSIWDSNLEDGDVISVFVNDEKVLNKIALKKKPRIFDFTLPSGEDEYFITIYSDSFGKMEPNTATVRIEDGSNTHTILLTSSRNKQESIRLKMK